MKEVYADPSKFSFQLNEFLEIIHVTHKQTMYLSEWLRTRECRIPSAIP